MTEGLFFSLYILDIGTPLKELKLKVKESKTDIAQDSVKSPITKTNRYFSLLHTRARTRLSDVLAHIFINKNNHPLQLYFLYLPTSVYLGIPQFFFFTVARWLAKKGRQERPRKPRR